MDTKLFAEWLEHGFNECITRRKVTKPVILFIDGAKVHLSIEASEFCANNNIILYTLYPNATHLIQPLDLTVMGSVKAIYKEEMRRWLMRNIGETFDKYRFIEVFKETYERSCTFINAAQGFQKAGIVPWNPQKVKTGKLYPAELYTRQEAIPHVAADTSTNEPNDEPHVASGTANVPETSTEKAAEKTAEKTNGNDGNDGMVITVGKKRFRLVEVEAEEPKTRDEKINEVLEIPKAKNVKLGPCQVPGLPRCVSSQEFRDRVKEIEDRKKKKRDEIEKRKAEWKAEAERKRVEKKSGKKIRSKRKERKEESSESEDNEEIEYDDESSGLDKDEENALQYRCAECGERLTGAARREAIGCDNEYCGRWYHPRCTDIDVRGKTEQEIQAMDFICRHC